jgi:transcription antitermination protein NusB
MVSRRKGRRLAVQALYSWDVGHTDPSTLLEFPWYGKKNTEGEDVAEEDLSFPQLIVRGTIERIEDVDRLIAEHLEHWDINRLARVDLAILRVGTYCLLCQPDIPPHVTIDEAVELAKELSSEEAYRFVNGVLDGIRKRINHQVESPARGDS